MDPFGISKMNREAKNSAVTTAGLSTAGFGALAGGIPGVRGDVKDASRLKETNKGKSRVKRLANGAVASAKASKGGILGFRTHAHEGGTVDFKQKATLGEWHPSTNPKIAYIQGRHRGKVAPEETIIRNMRSGKKVAGVAVGAGLATAAYGQKDKFQKNKQDKRSGVAIGAGSVGLGVSGGVGHLLGTQERRWYGAEAKSKEEAAKLVPGLKGKTDMEIARNPKIFHRVKPEVARAAGHLRGAAAQQEHFGDAFHTTGKITRLGRLPSAALIGVGVGGLAASKNRKSVQKSLSHSAFGVDHG